MAYNYGYCSKCGGGGIFLPPIKPTKPILLSKISNNYCSKCGKSLVRKCFSCNGTGLNKSPINFIMMRDRFCSECGREFDPPDNTCSSCDGTGEIREPFHYCF